MGEDAARVLAASTEKGKHVASDLKESRVPITFTEEQLQQLVNNLTSGTPREALLRIAREFIPKTGQIKNLLQEMLTTAPLVARIGVTRVVGDRFAAQVGSIEEDPEGRLIMELARHLEFYNFLLNRALTICVREACSLLTQSSLSWMNRPSFQWSDDRSFRAVSKRTSTATTRRSSTSSFRRSSKGFGNC
jgi:hypothetical protein